VRLRPQADREQLLDEGEAQMVACRATRRPRAKGRPPTCRRLLGKFMAIYLRYSVGDIDEDTARKEMAKEFGN
jgi:hypothetical protein